MNKQSFYHVKKRTLLAVAGCVWLIAGFNVARLGVLSYMKVSSINAIHILLSFVVFCAFGFMFFKMSIKHTKRIKGYKEEFRPIWHFFDLKSYIIMAIMMGGGIWLRAAEIVPNVFIAVFYTGLGCALALAGVLFGIMFILYKTDSDKIDK
ncbi:MAG: hypothetical protein ACI39F_03060 [Acutalibacteraceae bacterium]